MQPITLTVVETVDDTVSVAVKTTVQRQEHLGVRKPWDIRHGAEKSVINLF
jgi:hypothetical protein